MTKLFVLLLLNLCFFFANWSLADKTGSKLSYTGMVFSGFAVILVICKMGGWL